jgi:hypothetical protein
MRCFQLLLNRDLRALELSFDAIEPSGHPFAARLSGSVVHNRLGSPIMVAARFASDTDEPGLVAPVGIREDSDSEAQEKLEGILPVCMFCKSIRDAEEKWHRSEAYISSRSQAQFSHCVCPLCMGQLNACF